MKTDIAIVLIGALIMFAIGFGSGGSVATLRLQEQATIHCGAYFHPNNGDFTWVQCAEGLE